MYKPFIECKLETAIAGGKIDTLFLYAPCKRHTPITAKIGSMMLGGAFKFNQSLGKEAATQTDAPKKDESDDGNDNPFSDVSAAQMVMMLKSVPSDDYNFFAEFCGEFDALMLSDNICKPKDSDKSLAAGYYDQISLLDADKMMGDYLKNFFM